MMKKETWKPVTISGFTGILMGAASAYGVQTVMNGSTSATESETKPVDYDSMSFKDAFEAARSDMGPGGVFTWHGNVYNTYTAAEWNAKTQQEQQEFAEQVETQLASAAPAETADTQTEEVTAAVEPTEEGDVRVVAQNNTEDVAQADSQVQTASDETIDDNDVRVIGQGEMQLENGRTITIEDLELNGQRVRIIDVDQDGEADLAVSDLNHNHLPDEGEIIDLHTGEPLSFTNDNDDSSEVFTSVDI